MFPTLYEIRLTVDGPSIGLESEHLAHALPRRLPERLYKLIKVLEVRLVQGVSDDLDVQVVKILSGEAVPEVGRCE